MDPLAVMLMLAGVWVYPVSIVTQSWLQKKKQVLTPRGAIVFSGAMGSLFLLSALYWWTTLTELVDIETPMYRDSTIFWMATLWATAWNIFIAHANAKAREASDLTLTQPYQGMTPFLITATTLLFKERPTLQSGTGIALIGLGTYAHGHEGAVIPKKWPTNSAERWAVLREWALPLRRTLWLPANFACVPAEEKKQMRIDRRAVRWALASACAGTMGLIGDGLVARHGNIVLALTFQFGVIALWHFFVPLLLRGKRVEPLFKSKEGGLKKYWKQLLVLGPTHALSYVLMSTAYRLTKIAHIGSLKRLTIITVGILAWNLLGEKKWKRLVTASVITTGAIVLGTDPRANAYILGSAEQYSTRLKELLGL